MKKNNPKKLYSEYQILRDPAENFHGVVIRKKIFL